MTNQPPTIIDQLREAIRGAGTVYAVAKGSGVAHPVLLRFLSGERDIRLETAARLAVYLGLGLLPMGSAKEEGRCLTKGKAAGQESARGKGAGAVKASARATKATGATRAKGGR